MNKCLSSNLNNVVSIDLENSWAAQSLQDISYFYKNSTARFQQKQMQEKEEKLLRLYENQQQRAFDKVGRNSAGSNTSIGSNGGGKVRQLFEERRQKAGVDKSYPLQPINGKINVKTGTNNTNKVSNIVKQPMLPNSRKTTTNIQSTVQRSVTHVRNGQPLVNKRETFQKLYNNNNGIENYEEKHYNEDLLDSQSNLVNLMNKHNIYDNIDDEESPPLESGTDDVFFMGKLPNVGGIPPSQKVEDPAPKKTITNKTITRKSPVKTLQGNHRDNSQTPPSPVKNPVSNTTKYQKSNSPLRTELNANMAPQARISTSNAKSNRSPNTDRPSSKQQASRSAMSAVVRDDLQECAYCGRRFAVDRLNKHEDVCSKTNKKQRKVYDAFKHRVQGTEIEQFVGKKKATKLSAKKSTNAPVGQSKKNWRRTHEEFIATIRSAKVAQAHLARGGKLADLPPPPPSSNPDYIQCPSCGRRFNEAAAQRHIPKCASYEYNKPKPGATKKR